ncbi:MAG: Hsp20/alpha crystallin family protein [Chlorobium sp.]|nr:Hsp20/alpha crystallin family protein [Chlorobium sp.]MCW8814975.1 Hsp20/alpha crystallin family protein [Chlorobium sp.]MCW8820390.1 Hsp20/alpha crystallin family protein [Ignavibacteriaceae bacterium]
MLVQLSKDPLKMFDDIWEGSEMPSTPAFNVDISEDENAFHIEAEMPGVSKENISIGVEDDLLTIKGERKQKSEGQRTNYHLTERTYGTFSRSFNLGELIDQDAIDASYENGILHLTLQKAQPVSRKREIAIR